MLVEQVVLWGGLGAATLLVVLGVGWIVSLPPARAAASASADRAGRGGFRDRSLEATKA